MQTGIGNNCFIAQYRNILGWFKGRWKDCNESKYDGRSGDWYTSRFSFDTLEKATQFVEKEIDKNTVTIYTHPSWFK